MPKLLPLAQYTQRAYPIAGTALGKILVAASMAATSLGGCGPVLDARTVDSSIDSGDLDATTDGDAKPDADTGKTSK